MTKGRFLGLRLFLEGIEVDVVSAVITAGINRPATATIDIPACDAAHKFYPRTLVHLFYLESGYNIVTTDEKGLAGEPQPTGQVSDAVKRRMARGERSLDTADLSNWRLLFAGEIMGYAYSKVGAYRQIALQCQDFTSYWQQSKLYWGKAKVSANSYKKTVFSGATHLHVGKRAVTNSGGLLKLLTARPSTIPKLPGLLGGIVNLLESAVGVYDTTARKRYRGVNDYMTQAELRLKLTRTIAASPEDDSSSQFLNTKGFRRYLRQISRRVKSTASYLDLAQVLLGKCYHQWASLAAPPFVTAGQEATVTYIVSKGVSFKDAAQRDLYKMVDEAYAIANKKKQGNIHKARELQKVGAEGSEAHWNNVTPGEDKAHVDVTGIEKFSNDANTRLWGESFGTNDEKYRGSKNSKQGDRIHTVLHELDQAKKIYEGKIKEDQKLDPKADKDPAKHIKTFTNDVIQYDRHLENAKRGLTKLGGGTTQRRTKKLKLNSRLHMSLFTPDIYMVPPPTCNVLFPDHYSSINFSREWMSEVTRLWLHGRSQSGRDKKNMYFSPNTDILSGPKAKDATDAVKKGISFLMKHERFTGIVPSIEGLGDNDIFARLHKKTIKSGRKNLKARKDDAKEGRDMAGQAIFSPQEHLQRAANYLFFAKRYARRVMNVTARFSPQIIVGVPCLVLDPMKGQKSRFSKNPVKKQQLPESIGSPRGDLIDSLNPSSENEPIGTHYLGVVTNIRHQLDASGGAQTTIQLSKCRAHNEGVDLFVGPDDEVDDDGYAHIEKIKRRRTYRKVAQGVVAKRGESKDGSAILAGGVDEAQIEYMEGTTIKNRKFQRKRGKSYSLSITKFGLDSEISTNNRPVSLTKNSEGKLVQPPDKHGVSLAYGINQLPRAMTSAELATTTLKDGVYVDINEVKTFTNQIPVKFSFEGTTTPPWFSPIYMPSAIGDSFYQKMFGCGSILDEGIMTQFGPAALGLPKFVAGTDHVISFETNDGSGVKEVAIPADIIDQAVTVKEAAEGLAEFWLGLTEIGADIDLFIDVYTKRKYANILEVLGNTNPDMLVIAHNGVAPKVGEVEVVGFHGAAFGQQTLFEGFPEYEPLAMVDAKTPKRLLNPKLDTRLAKYRAVLSYKDEIASLGANNVYGFGEDADSSPYPGNIA